MVERSDGREERWRVGGNWMGGNRRRGNGGVDEWGEGRMLMLRVLKVWL